MEKMVTTPSYSTDFTEASIELSGNPPETTIALSEGTNRMRCSAIISLAISMGASSFWLAHQTHSAIAATVPISEKIEPTLKHEVKLGETLWQLSQNYHVAPEIIARVNNITLQTDLQVGQTLKIPTDVYPSSPRLEPVASPELDRSLANLRESRRKLRESLAALRSNQITEQPTLIAEQPTSFNLLEETEDPTAEIDESSSLAIELNRPIPIIVPTPETDITYLPVQPTLIPIQKTTPEIVESPATSVEDNTSELNPLPSAPKLITPASETVYQVQPGDTLKTIANSHGISVQTLLEANRITDPNLIEVNQTLIIPPTKGSPSPTFSQQLPPVPAVKPVTATPVTTPAQTTPTVVALEPVSSSEPEPSPTATIPVESSTQVYTEKIRADFANIEKTEPTPVAVPQTTVRIPVEEETRNSEWENDRTIPVRQKPQTVETQPTIVGAAAIPVAPYVDNLKIPVGTTVDPDLPTLNNPNQYLPGTQPVFQGFIWPAKGVLSSGYGWRWGRMHKGIDIAAPVGTPIFAAASGEVISAGWNTGGYGNLVKIQHADGSVTLYAHNSKILVRKGQKIEQGQQISAMGSTGRSTGPHLHFEVRPQGRDAVNPIAFLPKKKT